MSEEKEIMPTSFNNNNNNNNNITENRAEEDFEDDDDDDSNHNRPQVGHKRSAGVVPVAAKKFRPEREKDAFDLRVVEFPDYNVYSEGRNVHIKLEFTSVNKNTEYVVVCRLDSDPESMKEFSNENPGVENNVAKGRYHSDRGVFEFTWDSMKFTRSTIGRVGVVRFGLFLRSISYSAPIFEITKEIKVVSNSNHLIREHGHCIFQRAVLGNDHFASTDVLTRKRGPVSKKNNDNAVREVTVEALVVEINRHFDREKKNRRHMTAAELESVCESKTINLADFVWPYEKRTVPTKCVWQRINRALAIVETSGLYDQGCIRFGTVNEVCGMPGLVDGVFQIRFGPSAEALVDVYQSGAFVPVAKWTNASKESLDSFVARCTMLKQVIKINPADATFSLVDKSQVFTAVDRDSVPLPVDPYPLVDAVADDGSRR